MMYYVYRACVCVIYVCGCVRVIFDFRKSEYFDIMLSGKKD